VLQATVSTQNRQALFVNASSSANKTSVVRLINLDSQGGTVSATAYNEAGNVVGSANFPLATLAANQTLTYTSAQLETAVGYAPSAPTAKYRVVFSTDLPNLQVLNFIKDNATGNLTLAQPQTDNRVPDATGSVTRNALFVNASTSANKTSVLRLINPGDQGGALSATAYNEAGSAVGTAGAALGPLGAQQMMTITSAQLEAAIGYVPAAPTAKYRIVFNGALPNLEIINFVKDIASGSLTLGQDQLDDRSVSSTSNVVRNALFVNASGSANKTNVLRLINAGSQSGTVSASAYDEAGNSVGTPNAALGNLAAQQMLGFTSAQLEAAIGFQPASASAKYRIVFNTSLPNFEIINFIKDVTTGNLTLGQAQIGADTPAASATTRDAIFINASTSANKTSVIRLINLGAKASVITASASNEAGERVGNANAALATLGAQQTLTYTSAQLESAIAYLPASPSAKYRVVFNGSSGFELINFIKDIATGNLTLAHETIKPGKGPYRLNVAVTGSGSVASAPLGIDCGLTCSASFASGISVMLIATPASGYGFSGWGGACSGTGSCSVSMTRVQAVTATFASTASTLVPKVAYTDIVSGPTSGGESNLGAYLSIFGRNFGSSGLGASTRVYIGGVEVAAYRSLGASRVQAVSGLQQITVQVGSLGGAAQGVALPIKVTVSGVDSNTNVSFMPNPGRMLFVDNLAGNDATAVPGDITKPYRYVQTPALYIGGAWAVVQPGDMIVLRGHGNANPWTDIGFEHYFMRYRNKSGSAPTGAVGTGAIVLMGYPGEDAYIRGAIAGGMTGGCVSAINGQSYPGMGQWAVIANLRMDCEGYDGPISQEIFGHNWRIVNNDLAASTAPRTGTSIPRMAGITGNGNNAVWYGNHIHDIQGSAQECHGIYIDGDGSYDIAYNHIHDIRDGNGFQVYVNGGNGTTEANNVSLHHNFIHDVSKHGLNIADGMHSGLRIWNNIVYNTANAALRFNTNTITNSRIYNNTFYNTNTSGFYGALMNDWSFAAGALDLQNNIFHVKSGVPYTWWNNGIAGAGTIARNLWFNGSGGTGFDSAPITLDPLFVNAAAVDFRLQGLSPAIGAGAVGATLTALVTDDFEFKARNGPIDLGAFQSVNLNP
jgi:hypothetical protein